MCQCDPTIKTPFCGKPGCEWPTVAKPQEPKRDYSLLRPFDLEAAKAGEQPISKGKVVRYVAGPDCTDRVCCENQNGFYFIPKRNLYAAPLAWVEERPVYKGDVLYVDGAPIEVTGGKDGEILSNLWSFDTKYLTWQKPKVKKSGWVNIYPSFGSGCLHPSKEAADLASTQDYLSIDSGRVACIEIHWEE